MAEVETFGQKITFLPINDPDFYSRNEALVNKFIKGLPRGGYVGEEGLEKLRLRAALMRQDTSGQVRAILLEDTPIGFSNS